MSAGSSTDIQEIVLKRLGEVYELISAQSIISGAILGALSQENPMVVAQVVRALRDVVSESTSPALNAHIRGFLDGIEDAE